MKKTLVMTALSAFAALLCVSCNKPDNGGNNTDQNVVFEEPAYLGQAAVVTFPSTGTSLNVDKQKLVKPEKLILMESGHYVFMGKLVGTASFAPVKAEGDNFIRSGKYTFASGVYDLAGFGKAEISSGKISIDVGGNPVSYEGGDVHYPSAPSAGTESNMVRSWTPSGKVKVTIPSKGISTNLEPSLEAVAAYLQEHKVNINKEDYVGYQISFISLSMADNTFTVGFANKYAYVGTWKWADKNAGKFTYSFSTSMGSELISGTAGGTVKFFKEGGVNKCGFVMEISAKGTTANLEFNLVEAK